MDEARKKRAAALEEKRKRLEEMRKKRAEREVTGTVARSDSLPESAGGAADDGQNLNDYINSLLAAPAPVTSTPKSPMVRVVAFMCMCRGIGRCAKQATPRTGLHVRASLGNVWL